MKEDWSVIKGGKHEGKTLPELIFTDPDYFFYGYAKNYFQGNLWYESQLIYKRATAIKVPERNGQTMWVKYIIDEPTGTFGTMQVIPENEAREMGSDRFPVMDVIDMSFPKSLQQHDKPGYKNFLIIMKNILFNGKKVRMTKEKCTEFFNDDNNFKL